MDSPLLFLIKLAWACRYRLPLLITFAFMALDVRMQLEINVQTRRILRHPHLAHQRRLTTQTADNVSNASSNSWLTLDEDDDEDDDGDDEDEDNILFENAREDVVTPSSSSQNVDI